MISLAGIYKEISEEEMAILVCKSRMQISNENVSVIFMQIASSIAKNRDTGNEGVNNKGDPKPPHVAKTWSRIL